MIICKRVYDRAEESDGRRILVDRLWPRGVKKNELHYDEWLKAVAPSAKLRRALHGGAMDIDAFKTAYADELKQCAEPVAALRSMARGQNLTLLYASTDTEHNHARVLADYLTSG